MRGQSTPKPVRRHEPHLTNEEFDAEIEDICVRLEGALDGADLTDAADAIAVLAALMFSHPDARTPEDYFDETSIDMDCLGRRHLALTSPEPAGAIGENGTPDWNDPQYQDRVLTLYNRLCDVRKVADGFSWRDAGQTLRAIKLLLTWLDCHGDIGEPTAFHVTGYFWHCVYREHWLDYHDGDRGSPSVTVDDMERYWWDRLVREEKWDARFRWEPPMEPEEAEPRE
jgi:hypothetical protein